ncbi:MAG TPA: DUF6114 domain-containing protein [Actinomycetes bacterium]|nr:DUF6114 domain-containing protein [Actinomycetes bacterium]
MSAEHGQDPAVGGTQDENLGWRQRFRYWRATRPFWAGVITAFAGLWLIWSPQVAIGGLSMTIGIVTDGWLIGALLIILAIGMWLQPQVRGLAGAMVIVLSLGSFIKINFGGFLIGMLAGLVGGAMAIAWTADVPSDELEDEDEEQEFEEPSDHLIPMADYREDRQGVISNPEPVTEPVGEAVEPAPEPAPPEPPPASRPTEQPPAPRPTEMAPSQVRLTPPAPAAEPAPLRPSWPAVDSDGERTTGDAGRVTIALSEAVAVVSVLAVVLVLGASSAAVGQDGSPTPSPPPSPSEPPSPTPTPTVSPSPSTSPTATPSASPTATPSPIDEPSPTTTPPKQVRAAGEPSPAGMTGRLTADSSTMSGLQFGGVVSYQDTPRGTVRALRFTADRNELNDMTLRVTIGGLTTTIIDGDNDTTVLAGNVVMDVTRIAGNLGGVPVEFTADNPPPQVVSPMVLTDLSADLLLVQADRMDVPSMNQGFG